MYWFIWKNQSRSKTRRSAAMLSSGVRQPRSFLYGQKVQTKLVSVFSSRKHSEARTSALLMICKTELSHQKGLCPKTPFEKAPFVSLKKMLPLKGFAPGY